MFVTGGTGLLGSHLVRRLYAKGAEIVCLARDSVPRAIFYQNDPNWSLHQKVTIVRGDIRDAGLLERVLNEYEIDTVFHLAAQALVGTASRGPLDTFETNIQGTWNLLEACRRFPPKRIIVASSDKAYGALDSDRYDETHPLQGRYPYDVSKSCADLLTRSYFESYGLPVAITRCGNLFGPGDLHYNRLIPGTIRSILLDERPIIRSDGDFVRDFIFVEDAADAYLKLAEHLPEQAGEAFNFSYESDHTVKAIVNRILLIMGSGLTSDVRDTASNEIKIQRLDSGKAKKLLGWKPECGFERGLQKTIDWYQWTHARNRLRY